MHHIALEGGDFEMILLVRAVHNIVLHWVIFDHLRSRPGVRDRYAGLPGWKRVLAPPGTIVATA